MSLQDTQERSSSDVAQLVEAIDRLVGTMGAPIAVTQAICSECGRPFSDDDWSPEDTDEEDDTQDAAAEGNGAVMGVAISQAIFLGYEIDQCSAVLRVKNRNNHWATIPRGAWTTVDVAIDGNGYWYWRCGSTLEKSRGAPNFRARVKRLKVFHSPNSRKITWKCYDLL